MKSSLCKCIDMNRRPPLLLLWEYVSYIRFFTFFSRCYYLYKECDTNEQLISGRRGWLMLYILTTGMIYINWDQLMLGIYPWATTYKNIQISSLSFFSPWDCCFCGHNYFWDLELGPVVEDMRKITLW